MGLDRGFFYSIITILLALILIVSVFSLSSSPPYKLCSLGISLIAFYTRSSRFLYDPPTSSGIFSNYLDDGSSDSSESVDD